MNAVTAVRVRQPGGGARLVEYKPWPHPNASLIGHASVDFSGWIVCEIPIFKRADGSISAGSPSAAKIDSEGRQRILPNGKRDWWAVVRFEGDGRERWNRAVLGALADAGIVP
jgi:hypothetical protein